MRAKSSRQKKASSRKKYLVIFLCLILLVVTAGVIALSHVDEQLYPLEYGSEVNHWASEYGVDEYLVYAIISTESSFDPNAESSAAARGLMQMTEDTFDWVKSKIAPDEALTFDDLYTPETSIRFGTYLMSISLERYGDDISTAAAAYHSGWGTVDGLLESGEYSHDGVRLHTFPYPQMSHYVTKINDSYEKYTALYA